MIRVSFAFAILLCVFFESFSVDSLCMYDKLCAEPVEFSRSGAHAMLQTKRSRLRTQGLQKDDSGYLAIGIGSTAAFDENGYWSVATTCCTLEMEDYVRRLIQHLGFELCNEHGLLGFIPWFACTEDSDLSLLSSNGIQSFAKLLADLKASIPPADCAFIASPGKCPTSFDGCGGPFPQESHRRRSCYSPMGAEDSLAPFASSAPAASAPAPISSRPVYEPTAPAASAAASVEDMGAPPILPTAIGTAPSPLAAPVPLATTQAPNTAAFAGPPSPVPTATTQSPTTQSLAATTAPHVSTTTMQATTDSEATQPSAPPAPMPGSAIPIPATFDPVASASTTGTPLPPASPLPMPAAPTTTTRESSLPPTTTMEPVVPTPAPLAPAPPITTTLATPEAPPSPAHRPPLAVPVPGPVATFAPVPTTATTTTTTTTTTAPNMALKCNVIRGESSGSSDSGSVDHSCQYCNEECDQLSKQKAIYIGWGYDPPLAERNIFDVKSKSEWVDFSRLLEYGSTGIFQAASFRMDLPEGEAYEHHGYMGPQIKARAENGQHVFTGQHLFSMWDTRDPNEDGTSPPGRRLVVPAIDPGFCKRNCQDCALQHLQGIAAAGLTTGTQCKTSYIAKAGGQAFTYRARMSNPFAFSVYEGETYLGTEWEVTVVDEADGIPWVLGRVLLAGDTASTGIKRLMNFHEHIGCTPCDAYYERTIVHRPEILEPNGVHTIMYGRFSGLNEEFSCRLHREIALPDFSVQIETGPGVTPDPISDVSGGLLFSCDFYYE